MKKLTVFIIVAVFLCASLVMADEASVTVYNSNVGVVSEVRELDFQQGMGSISFRDVPDQIDAASVRFEVVDGAGDVSILEQNYAYDLVSSDKIFAKYVDQEIQLIDKDGQLFSGTLLAANSGAVILRDDQDRIKVLQTDNIAQYDFPSLPDGLITRPTLFWNYQSEASGLQQCRVSYQTSGLTWQAEYVGVLNEQETSLDLSGWASITNNTSKTFEDAGLKLVAGDIARATPDRRGWESPQMAMSKAGDVSFEEKSFFEYHLYTLPRKSTLAAREVKQISLFEPATTDVTKKYIFRVDRSPSKVEVTVNFVNSDEAGLGMPLPEGRVRMFKADDDGSLVLIGESLIDHTPRDEELDLRVGYAFDIVGESKMLTQTRISQNVEEQQYQIELRNRKDGDVTVTVEKKLYGDWKIISSSMEYKKEDAQTMTFDVTVPAGTTLTATFTARITR